MTTPRDGRNMLEASKVPAAPGNEVTMTSATARPGRHARQGSGLVIFAAVLLLVVGFFNLIDGSRENLAG